MWLAYTRGGGGALLCGLKRQSLSPEGAQGRDISLLCAEDGVTLHETL